MNDVERNALVEEIEAAMHEYADVYERAMHGFTWNQEDVATAKNQAVDAILAATMMYTADRAVPEPDADAVERVAKAITSIWNKPSPNPTAFPASAEMLARAAIAAVPAPDDNWLDDALDSVGQHGADIGEVTRLDDGTYEASVDVIGIRGGMAFLAATFHGAGPTRKAAIEDAVAKAKESE